MDAYLVHDAPPEDSKSDTQPTNGDTTVDVSSDETIDNTAVAETHTIGDLEEDPSDYINTIRNLASAAEISIPFDLHQVTQEGTNGIVMLKFILDALNKLFKERQTTSNLTRRTQTMQANIHRLQHVKAELEQDRVRLDKEAARLESLVQKQKQDFIRDTQNLRQEMKEVKLDNTKIKGLRSHFQAKLRIMEKEKNRLQDTLSRHLQQRDRKYKSGMALAKKLQNQCSKVNTKRKAVRAGAKTATAPATQKKKSTSSSADLRALSVRELKMKNKQLSLTNKRCGELFQKITDTLQLDIDGGCLLQAEAEDLRSTFETALFDRLQQSPSAIISNSSNTNNNEPHTPVEAPAEIVAATTEDQSQSLANLQAELDVSFG